MDRLRIVWTYLRVGLLNELQYRANFFTSLVEAMVSLVVALGGLALVYSHTDTLNGWRSWELLVLVGVYYIMGAWIGAFVQPSMEALMRGVRNGTLDFTLTKPEDAQLLISVRGFAVWRLVNLILGIGIIAAGFVRGGNAVSAQGLAAFAVVLAAGAVIVYSFWLMLATISFWYVKVDNTLVVFQTMYEAGRWPVTIYPQALRLVLTLVVPVAFAVTVPAEALVGRATLWRLGGAILLASVLFVAARLFLRAGVRHYSGASA